MLIYATMGTTRWARLGSRHHFFDEGARIDRDDDSQFLSLGTYLTTITHTHEKSNYHKQYQYETESSRTSKLVGTYRKVSILLVPHF